MTRVLLALGLSLALGAGPAALDLSMQTVRFGLNMKF
jgi:hypothetical protein